MPQGQRQAAGCRQNPTHTGNTEPDQQVGGDVVNAQGKRGGVRMKNEKFSLGHTKLKAMTKHLSGECDV